jgi:hypothetical protein
MEPIEWALIGKKIGGFFKSKWLYIALAVIAVGGGTYLYLQHDKKEAVTTAVKAADTTATIKSQAADIVVTTRNQAVDQKMDRLKVQTVKDFTNARATLQAAPASDRDAQAPRVIIDTINDLDRLRAGRDDAGTVSNTEVPAG